MDQFPPMMRAQIDLKAMLDPHVINTEMSQMEARIEKASKGDKKTLQFMAMFLYYNSGKLDEAKRFARALRGAVGGDSALSGYADFILNQQRPDVEDAHQPEKPPAETPEE